MRPASPARSLAIWCRFDRDVAAPEIRRCLPVPFRAGRDTSTTPRHVSARWRRREVENEENALLQLLHATLSFSVSLSPSPVVNY